MEDILPIIKDDRKVEKIGEKVVIDIHQIHEMPFINVKNMVESWTKTNIQMDDYLKKEKEILEMAIAETENRVKETISNAEDILAMNDEKKEEYLKDLWTKEYENSKKILENREKMLEEAKNMIKAHHNKLLTKLKTDLKNNKEGIELYSKVLK